MSRSRSRRRRNRNGRSGSDRDLIIGLLAPVATDVINAGALGASPRPPYLNLPLSSRRHSPCLSSSQLINSRRDITEQIRQTDYLPTLLSLSVSFSSSFSSSLSLFRATFLCPFNSQTRHKVAVNRPGSGRFAVMPASRRYKEQGESSERRRIGRRKERGERGTKKGHNEATPLCDRRRSSFR